MENNLVDLKWIHTQQHRDRVCYKATEYSDWYFNKLIDGYNIVFHAFDEMEYYVIHQLEIPGVGAFVEGPTHGRMYKKTPTSGQTNDLPKNTYFLCMLTTKGAQKGTKSKNCLIFCWDFPLCLQKRPFDSIPYLWNCGHFEDQHLQTCLTFFQHITNISN